ncbi:HAD family phosphatase [Kitasatospora atroaurantiaca]|uniref:HAD superfamily hydrolase (TIGR01509 family) n=1 Tax=Kitasatospora atroaurantiaca TaxID=285545 RepID=A0A561EYZ1_9ACTN|nr:HAD family phosphatase [Kitasatospora atroaurantiaca]TWE20815.1 HAD superfamily hydrolase (TIGR01509 family) [Kitasatospora atroaurantiaca]
MTTISTLTGTLDRAGGDGLQAVLLDMDGTLVDTEDFWWQAEFSLFAELGHQLDETDRAHVVGGPMSRVIDYLIATTKVNLSPAELTVLINQRFVDLLAGGVPLMPGAELLLNTLNAHGIPAALVSASHRHIIDIVLESLGAHHFAFSVAGDEVPRTKPHPDPYLAAVARLGAEPGRCVVVEDAPTGVLAAEAAGCPVIAVPSVARIEPGPGRTVLSSLELVDLPLLHSLVAARV